MSILPGIPLSFLLEMFPAAFVPTVLAVAAEGIVLFLQAIAYILVSLAALAVLLRLGLKGGGHGCGCRRSRQGEASAAEHGIMGAGSAEKTAEEAGTTTAHGHTNNCCESASSSIGDRARFSAQSFPQDAQHTQRLRQGTQHPPQVSDRFPPAGGQSSSDSVVASIHAASSPPPTDFANKAAAPQGEGINADGQLNAADAAAEQRRITAVIAAAVHNVLGGQPHRIVRIEPISYGWAQEGRRDIFSSRRVR